MTDIRDVAGRAGVSVGTVSRVLNRHPSVSPALRERVLTAIDELDWQPHRIARNLRTGRSQTVGLVVVDISHPFYPDVVRAAEAAVEGAGFTLVLANTYDDVGREDRVLDLMLDQRVAGVLMSPANGDNTLVEGFRRARTPVVFLDAPPSETTGPVCSVHADDVRGARRAVEHLGALGHRSLLVLTGPDWMRQCVEREAGARQTAAALGMGVDVVTLPDLTARSGEAAALRLLAGGWRWSAVFCVQDAVAVGLQRALLRHGVRLPEEVSVVGYDDVDAAAFAPVPLTTVHKPRADMGRIGGELLLAEMRAVDGHRHASQVVDTRLVLRESTAPHGG